MATPADELRTSLEAHNEIFESLLKLIPARYYLANELTEEQVGTYNFSVFTSFLLLATVCSDV
jgi:hypothetical protein